MPVPLGRWRSHPSPKGFSLGTRKGGCWVWRKSQALGGDPCPVSEQHRVGMCSSPSLAPGSSTVLFPLWGAPARRLLGQIGNAPKFGDGSDRATPGLCTTVGSVHGHSKESGYHRDILDVHQPACKRKRRGEISPFFQMSVSGTLLSMRLMGL